MIAQTVTAGLGKIPRHALAVGVEVREYLVTLHFQLSQLSAEGRDDIANFIDALETVIGDEIEVRHVVELMDQPRLSPADRVCWVFLQRPSDS